MFLLLVLYIVVVMAGRGVWVICGEGRVFFLLFQRLQLLWGIGPQGQIDRPIRRGMSIQAPSTRSASAE